MRVLVTGGTGYVGSHTVKALLDGGHDVRVLVRAPERLTPALAPLGIDRVDHIVGSVTEAAVVRRALEGCEAVVHAANVYSLDAREGGEMATVNPRSTETVLSTANGLGLDPIVHVSSTVAMTPSGGRTLTAASPPASPPGPYASSKAAADRIARRLQADGAPIVIVTPGAVFGPHDPHLGEFATLTRNVLRGLMPVLPSGVTPVADVRDVAEVHARVMEPGQGPRRYLVSGGDVPLVEITAQARRLTGRRLPTFAGPAGLVVAGGRAADLIQRRLPFRLPISWEGSWLAAQHTTSDASETARELGLRFRPPLESIADTIRWLYDAGHLSHRQAGRLAAQPPALALR